MEDSGLRIEPLEGKAEGGWFLLKVARRRLEVVLVVVALWTSESIVGVGR